MSDDQKPATPETSGPPVPAVTPPAKVEPAAAAAEGKPAAKPAPAKPAAKAEPKAPPGPPLPPDPPPPADLPLPAFVTALQAAHGADVEAVSYWVGDWTVIVKAGALTGVLTFLREDPSCAFDYLSDLTAVDWPPREQRFDVVYCLYSTTRRQRLRVKARVKDQEAVASAAGIWTAANWLEREVFDMFGVRFTGHPDLRRILLPADWQGYPQRKDYPLEGPGELLMESPQDWLKARQTAVEADIE